MHSRKKKKRKPTNRRTKRQTHRFHGEQRLFCRRQRRHRRRGLESHEKKYSHQIQNVRPNRNIVIVHGSFVQYVIRNVLRMTRSLVTSCMQHMRPKPSQTQTHIDFVCMFINKTRERERDGKI